MIFELLAPAGNLEKLKIAILYGADAVYIAGQHFSLRRAASNFSLEELRTAIDFAHQRGKRAYVTVNAFLHEAEINQLSDYLKQLEHIQPDALICSDLGVVHLASQYTTIPIHISTQASVTNSYHAQLWKEFGAKRIVVGREVSIEEAAQIKANTGLEIEMFIHGAMCMGYSGHCFMSTFIADRDSNRGGCIQNCRYLYDLQTDSETLSSSFLLSSKDLCGIQRLSEFISADIDAVKIEGRMKSNLYIASTVRAYAHALAEIRGGSQAGLSHWLDELKKVPYRGYTEGFLRHEAGPDSIFDQSKEIGKEYKMAGTVLEIDIQKERFAFQLKNRILPGDQIEILPFKGDPVSIKIETLTDISEQSLPVAQPHNVIWLPWRKGIDILNIGRIPPKA